MITLLWAILALLAFNTLVAAVFILPQLYHDVKRRREVRRLKKAYYASEEDYATDRKRND